MKNLLEWRVNLCRANKQMMQTSKQEIQEVVDTYPTLRKFTDFLSITQDIKSAKYNMACRFIEKYA